MSDDLEKYFWGKKVEGETLSGDPEPPEYKKAKYAPKPKRFNYDKNMLKRIKKLIVQRFLPTLRELLDVDIDVDVDDGIVTVFASVTFAGQVLFSVSKTYRV